MFSASGSTKRTMEFLKKMEQENLLSSIEAFAQMGVSALQAATPIDSGITAASWGYEISETRGGLKVQWTNDSFNENVNIAVLVQYGHANWNGTYVSGVDYINPAMVSIFERAIQETWEKVTTA